MIKNSIVWRKNMDYLIERKIEVKIKKLNFQYSKKAPLILNNFSYTFSHQQITIITGDNGCGKSTLLNLIAGNLEKYQGEINFSLDSKKSQEPFNIKSKRERKKRREHFGFVFQHDLLIPSLSLRENLEIPLRFLNRPNREIYIDRLNQELKTLYKKNWKKKLKQSAGSLSGGEKKKLAILRAIIHSPSLLLVDEPTNNLDQEGIKWFLNLLTQLHKQGVNIILVTHDSIVENLESQLTPSPKILTLGEK